MHSFLNKLQCEGPDSQIIVAFLSEIIECINVSMHDYDFLYTKSDLF